MTAPFYLADGGPGSPFTMTDESAYRHWRDKKLAGYPASVGDLVVPVADPAAPTEEETAAIRDRIRRANMAVYAGPPDPELDKAGVRALGRVFGLDRLDSNMLADDDGITPLAVAMGGTRTKYIPYTDKPISWHSDGYYNPVERWIRGLILHCVRNAAEGGENALIDQEMLYIQLRDENPAHIVALSRPDAMTIPGNAEDGFPPRPDSVGPVFSVHAESGTLHMRYTDRKRNIAWNPDPAVRAAVAQLKALLHDAANPYVFRHTLQPGQGLICNNVPHTRTAFSDAEGAERLLYRARYFDRVSGT